MSHIALREPQPRLGNPQDATLSTHSCTGFRIESAQTAPARRFLNLIQTPTVCSWPWMIKGCWTCRTPTQKEAWQRILQCLATKNCLYFDPNNQKPIALKKISTESFISTGNCRSLEKLLKHGSLWSSENAMLTLHLN